MTPSAIEKQCSVIYTNEVFSKFQEQIVAARDHRNIQGISECEDIKCFTMSSLTKGWSYSNEQVKHIWYVLL